MFQHILFATDGSPAAQTAAQACIRFAAQVGARVTALHVVPTLHLFTYEFEVTEQARATFRRNCDIRSREALGPVERLAREARVQCATRLVESDDPYEAILAVARQESCDLIAMASHGRRGVRAVLIGSTTQKVLTHSKIPVLVFR